MRTCETCGEEIAAGRLEVLPNTRTCKDCCKEKPKIGFMISTFSKGTASEIVYVPTGDDDNDKEQRRRAQRANARRR